MSLRTAMCCGGQTLPLHRMIVKHGQRTLQIYAKNSERRRKSVKYITEAVTGVTGRLRAFSVSGFAIRWKVRTFAAEN